MFLFEAPCENVDKTHTHICFPQTLIQQKIHLFFSNFVRGKQVILYYVICFDMEHREENGFMSKYYEASMSHTDSQ